MAKKIAIEETEDGELLVDLKPTRKFKGTDADPVDAETGDSVFDDLNPRFSKKLDEAVAKAEANEETATEEEEEATDEEEIPVETADDDQDETTDEEESETDDVDEEEERPAKNVKRDAFSKRMERADRLLAEQRAETAALRERLNKQEADNKAAADEQKFTAEKVELDGKLVEVRKKLAKAIEDGDTAAQVEAGEALAEVKGDLKVLTVRHTNAKIELERAKTQRQSGSEIVKIKSDQWIRRHNRFTTDKEFAATAKSVDSQVAAAGFNPETDEYYKELDKRMSKFYPKEFKLAAKMNQEAPRRTKPPVTGSRREEGGGSKVPKKLGPFAVRNGKVLLTPRNIQTMRDFGLDPQNANDVRDFVEQNRTQG
jgi:hypothetical protein